MTGLAPGDSYVKLTGIIVGNFEINPGKNPKRYQTGFVCVAQVFFFPKTYQELVFLA